MSEDFSDQNTRQNEPIDFERANQEPQPTLVAEFIDFLKHNKKWWLAPILIVLGMLGLLVAFSGSAAAPFIYSLF